MSRSAQFLGTAVRYFLNAVILTREQEGWRSAAITAVSLSVEEARKIPHLLRLGLDNRHQLAQPQSEAPVLNISQILQQLKENRINVETVTLDRDAFDDHMSTYPYPRFYAGGSVKTGGMREAKILEYFISLTLLPISGGDVIIDVASERSVFPDMIRATFGARAYRQDLIYTPGLHGERIGGSADEIPVPPRFADKLFLHNSFEHFEGDADTNFIAEAWRVLKPGGGVCILPLYLSTRPQILTDPLLDTSGITWDADAEIVERIGHHNRFGRCYSVKTLVERVLEPASRCGFEGRIYHFTGVDAASGDPISRAQRGLRFALVLRKPAAPSA